MRTTLNISDELLGEVMKLSGVLNKTRVIEMALREFMRKLKNTTDRYSPRSFLQTRRRQAGRCIPP